MTFSILASEPLSLARTAPDFFVDLNLDQIVSTVTAGHGQYDLAAYFHTPLHSVDAVHYRHEVVRDLEQPSLRAKVYDFAKQMAAVRDNLKTAEKLHYKYQKEALFRDAVETYCAAVVELSRGLGDESISSRGFFGLGEFLAAYVASDPFIALTDEARKLADALGKVTYLLHINGGDVTAMRYEAYPDYSVEVAATFERFKQGSVKAHGFKFSDAIEMDHIEANVLGLVAQLYPETFASLSDFQIRNADFLDGTIVTFDREVQFYLAYLEHADALRKSGLAFCLPTVSVSSKAVRCVKAFDLALARKLAAEKEMVVTNDFYLTGAERIIVVSGPNQGGKTTFARTFGQLHHLASLGLPVPGSEASLFLCDRIFTHFERVEDIATHRGKLQDDLVRIHHILGRATGQSIIIMNEIFTSTALEDALFLSRKVMGRIRQLGSLGVCVTFIDELASLGLETVSMVSTVVPENPAERTFKIVRKPADGLAYAMSVAEKYGLTFESVRERIAS